MKGPVLIEGGQCFFSNDPIKSIDDATKLCYPSLYNVYPRGMRGFPLGSLENFQGMFAWLCGQKIRYGDLAIITDPQRRLAKSVEIFLANFFNNFNDSVHEQTWFDRSMTNKCLSFKSIEEWEARTRDNPSFILNEKWIPVGKSLREIADFSIFGDPVSCVISWNNLLLDKDRLCVYIRNNSL
jgi:hypothetical protein